MIDDLDEHMALKEIDKDVESACPGGIGCIGQPLFLFRDLIRPIGGVEDLLLLAEH